MADYPRTSRQQADAVRGNSNKKYATFLSAMEVTLITGHWLGLLPVIGISELDASKLRFKMISWCCFYTLISIVGQFSLVYLLFISLFKNIVPVPEAQTISSFTFYALNAISAVLFLRISSRWPKLCLAISKIEAKDPNTDSQIRRNCNISCFAILTLALLEYLLSALFSIAMALDCEPHRNMYEAFVMYSFPWLCVYIPYNHFLGIVSHIVNVQCVFTCYYNNLFIIVISLYLTSRLEQVNKRVIAAKDIDTSPSFWRTMREDYNRAVQLVRQVDSIISGVVFITFACNLLFMCLQLWHIIYQGISAFPRCRNEGSPDPRPLHGYEYSVYFAFSFTFLVVRTLMVSLTAARVHTASRAPALALYEISSSAYCMEVQRFVEQIHGENVALSGLQFFSVKRGLLLTVAEIIVTYELVLLQFVGIKPNAPVPKPM